MYNLKTKKLKIMKKTILKLAISLIAIFMVSGVIAQPYPPTPYSQYDANLTNPTTIDYVTLRTGGSTVMGYYALPDVVFHPNYTVDGSLTTGFVWNWSIVPAMTITKPGDDNYVNINFTATGNYVVNVSEQSPTAYGGCSDPTPTVMNVTVINPPTAGFTTSDILTGLCGNTAAQSINISIVENVPNDLAAYGFSIREVIENIDMSGNPTATVSTNNTFVTFPLSSKVKVGVAGFTASTPDFDYDFNSSALDVRNNLRTRYTYILLKSTDATSVTEGIISAISQKSDYIAGTQLSYSFSDNTVVFIVNPVPSTGPIYAIPNSFAY